MAIIISRLLENHWTKPEAMQIDTTRFKWLISEKKKKIDGDKNIYACTRANQATSHNTLDLNQVDSRLELH